MDELNIILFKLNIGCNFNGANMNHMFYANVSVPLAPSTRTLQKDIDICFKYGNEYEFKYCLKQTECMWVKPKW